MFGRSGLKVPRHRPFRCGTRKSGTCDSPDDLGPMLEFVRLLCNAGPQVPPMAGAKRRLLAVACRPSLGGARGTCMPAGVGERSSPGCRDVVWEPRCGVYVESLDDMVHPQQQRLGNLETKSLGRLQVDHQLQSCRLLDRQVSRLGALEDPVDLARGASVHVGEVWPQRHEATGFRELSLEINGG
jgi:hypothetical protein